MEDHIVRLPSLPKQEKNDTATCSSTSLSARVTLILERLPQMIPYEKSVLDVCSKSESWLQFWEKHSNVEDTDNKLYTWLIHMCAQVRGSLMPYKQQRQISRQITEAKRDALTRSRLPKLTYMEVWALYFDEYMIGYERTPLTDSVSLHTFEPFIFYANGYAHLKPNTSCVRCNRDNVPLLFCNSCRLATYCSKACQTADWKDQEKPHSRLCKQLRFSYQRVDLDNGTFFLQPTMEGTTIFQV